MDDIIIQIYSSIELNKLRTFLNSTNSKFSDYTDFPGYIRLDRDTYEVIGRQSGVYHAGDPFLARFHRGIPVDDFISFYDQSRYEYW